jgi:hypothetical protein
VGFPRLMVWGLEAACATVMTEIRARISRKYRIEASAALTSQARKLLKVQEVAGRSLSVDYAVIVIQ